MSETATSNGSGNGRIQFDDDGVENPLHKLTDEQIEAIGKEFDELHDQVKEDLGDRDAAYIRGIIGLQRRLALLGRVLLVPSRSRPRSWSPARACWAWPRSSRTWRSGTTSCTASGTG